MPDNQPYGEKELLYQVAEGDEKAFKSLLLQYATSMMNIIRKLVKDDAAEQDIIQEVFIKVWLHRDELPQIEYLPAWLKKIALNESLIYLRKKTAYDKRVLIAASRNQEPVNNIDETLDYKELHKRLLQFIQSLPEQKRLIYELNRNEGLSPGEIAQQMGLSYGHVRNALSSITQSIRDHFIALFLVAHICNEIFCHLYCLMVII